ncbi:MAG: oxidoreductase [Rickettsiales bacterium]|nr:oxidoreductase [Rickettsiales bacterium]
MLTKMKVVFFGAGYCSKYIIPKLPSDTQILCTHKQNLKKEYFDSKLNLKRITLDEFLSNVDYSKNITHILNSIPPFEFGDIIIREFLKKVDIKKTLKWVGYLSATSVYGNHDGEWVNEESKTNPTSKRGILRLKAEDEYLSMFKLKNIPIHIFRLPGIYGPNRSVFERLNSENPLRIIKKKHFFSRIHVEDISNAIIKSFNKPTPGEIFNLTDDYPCESHMPIDYACKLLKKKPPPSLALEDIGISEMTKSFYYDNKKVSNKKIKKILNWTPKYRNYKLGIDSIFKNFQ